jgi:hypothetical protein
MCATVAGPYWYVPYKNVVELALFITKGKEG